MENNLNHLKSLLVKRRIIPVIGAGVSYSSSDGNQLSIWKGLLQNGIESIRISHSDGSMEEWAIAQKNLIKEGSATALIEVADQLVTLMGGQQSTGFAQWIKSTVGSLHVLNKAILNAVDGMAPFVATTNYDTLVEEVLGGPPVTWQNSAELHKIVIGDAHGVLHIHGCWTDPKTIVLDSNSYQEVTGDNYLQAALQSLLFTHSLMFIGFGSGLNDPNFSRLLEWLRTWGGKSPYGHFRLIRSSELTDVKTVHADDSRVLPIVYGDNYSDLSSFLLNLKNDTRKLKPDLNSNKRWRCLEDLTYPMIRDSPELKEAFFFELATAFILSKGEDYSGEVCMLYRLETRTFDQGSYPAVKIFCNDPHFLSVLRQRTTRIFTYGEKVKDTRLSPHEKMAMRQQLIAQIERLNKDWKVNVRANLIKDFRALKVRVTPEKTLVEVETILDMSINPTDYLHNVTTTSELFPFIASCCSMTSGEINADIFIQNPRLISLVIGVMDNRSINLTDVRYDSDSPEEWLYINNPFQEEIGEFLQTTQ